MGHYEEVLTSDPLARPAANTHCWLWAVWSNGEHLGLGERASGLVSGNGTSSLPLTRPCPGDYESHAQPHTASAQLLAKSALALISIHAHQRPG